MTTPNVKRKLTAIFSADVKGYSRLMSEDEVDTVEAIKRHREMMSSLIGQHRGRVIDSSGDNLLAEFASVVDAVQCAVEIQEVLRARNAEVPDNRKMLFRIGINLGDVIEDEGRIYGDGVNIAARIEGLAEPGGICISRSVYSQIKKKLMLDYEDMQEHTVKNITEPVRVYRIPMEPQVRKEKQAAVKKWPWVVLATALATVAAVTIWHLYLRPAPPPAEIALQAQPVLELSDKPSIAVLPFINRSGNPKDEYFSDGLTEQIITAISKIGHILVIARSSSFKYKGKEIDVQQVGRDLGVRHVMDGSVQRSGDRIRITVQLVDVATGRHRWAESYDSDLKDIFALQDEITLKVMTELQVKLTDGEQARLFAKGTKNLPAFERYSQGLQQIRRLDEEGNVLARKMAKEAIALDPQYPTAFALLGWTHLNDVWFHWSKSPIASLDKAFELAQKVIALDDSETDGHRLLGYVYLFRKQHAKAIAAGERAVALLPNGADTVVSLAEFFRYAGRHAEAIASYKKGIRLSPFCPSLFFHGLARSYFFVGQYEEAIAASKKALTRSPNSIAAHYGLAAIYATVGHEKEARAEAGEVYRLNPKFSLDHIAKTFPFKKETEKKFFIDSLRKAGLK